MSEFEKKLYDMYHADTTTLASTFTVWIIEHAEREHRKSVQMAGDLGAALSKIGDLERKISSLHSDMPLPPPPNPEM